MNPKIFPDMENKITTIGMNKDRNNIKSDRHIAR